MAKFNILGFSYLGSWGDSQSAPRTINAAPVLVALQMLAHSMSSSIAPKYFSFPFCIFFQIRLLRSTEQQKLQIGDFYG